jgi:hypothetical protein
VFNSKYLEDLFSQNTGKYFMLNNVGIFIYTKILGNTLCWILWEDLFTQNTGKYFMLNTGNIYLQKILGNTLWSAISVQHKYFSVFCVNKYSKSVQHKVFPSILCKLIFPLIYFMLNTVGRFIFTKYWKILYVE